MVVSGEIMCWFENQEHHLGGLTIDFTHDRTDNFETITLILCYIALFVTPQIICTRKQSNNMSAVCLDVIYTCMCTIMISTSIVTPMHQKLKQDYTQTVKNATSHNNFTSFCNRVCIYQMQPSESRFEQGKRSLNDHPVAGMVIIVLPLLWRQVTIVSIRS